MLFRLLAQSLCRPAVQTPNTIVPQGRDRGGRGGNLVLSIDFPTPFWYTIQLFESLPFTYIQAERGTL